MYKINATLLDKLFIAPSPMGGDPEILRVFNQLQSRMFPGKRTFEEFLSAQNIDVQFEKAELIIHRLCYESNFPPSYFAIKDIASVEEYHKGNTGEYDSYIPRDHFLHIVNLYLLGLYVFFYNTEFHRRLVKANRYRRKITNCSDYTIDCYKDFISEWKYFCLYHDIGYAQELFSSNIGGGDAANKLYKELMKEENDFCDSFGKKQVIRHNAFFGSLEILSSIISLKFILDYSKVLCNGENDIFKFFKDSKIFSAETRELASFEESCHPYLKGLYILDRVYSNQCIKRLLPLIGEENIAIAGINQDNGKVSFVSFCDENGRKLFYLEELNDDIEFLNFIENPSLIMFDDYNPCGYELVYLYDKCKYDYRKEIIDFYSEGVINKTYEYCIDQKCSLAFSSVSNEEQLLDFFFHVYIVLYRLIREYKMFTPSNKVKDKLEKKMFELLDAEEDIVSKPGKRNKWRADVSLKIQTILVKTCSKELKDSCISFINKQFSPRFDDKEYDDLSEYARAYIEEYIDNIKSNTKLSLDNLEDEIVLNMSERIQKVNSVLLAFATGYKALRYIYSQSVKGKKVYRYDFSGLKSVYNSLFIKTYMPEKIGGKEITVDKFMELYLKGITRNNDKSKSDYENGKTWGVKNRAKNRFRATSDHGFESAKYAGSVFEILQTSLKKSEKGVYASLMDILFSISGSENRKDRVLHYTDDYKHIYKNVIYSIIIHNVWPSEFSDSDEIFLDTSIEEFPFAYFALLCDSLQKWNRPQAISNSLEEFRPNLSATEEYNIEVSDNKIFIFEARNNDMQRKLNNFISGLGYLRNASAIVKNGYSV